MQVGHGQKKNSFNRRGQAGSGDRPPKNAAAIFCIGSFLIHLKKKKKTNTKKKKKHFDGTQALGFRNMLAISLHVEAPAQKSGVRTESRREHEKPRLFSKALVCSS